MLRELATAGSVIEAYQNEMSKVRAEKVIVIGAPVQWTNKHIIVEQDSKSFESKLQFHAATREKAAWAVVRDPKVTVTRDWNINFR